MQLPDVELGALLRAVGVQRASSPLRIGRGGVPAPGTDVLDGRGDPTPLGFALARLYRGRGSPASAWEIAPLYDGVTPDQGLVHAGAQEAIFAFCNVALRRGDHVIVAWPAYESLHGVARAAGAGVDLLPLRFEDGWALDLALLRSMLRTSTRAILVNFPHIPSALFPISIPGTS
ncbi:hypothetical protein BH23GEM8_BH23GEM8_23440 [soil metagenome]